MYQKIKELADEAIALQNKTRMDEVLREISGMCESRNQSICEQLKNKAHEIADEMSESVVISAAPTEDEIIKKMAELTAEDNEMPQPLVRPRKKGGAK